MVDSLLAVRHLLTPEGIMPHAHLTLANGVIQAIELQHDSMQDFDGETGILIPGFVDIQVNGGGGVLFNQQPTLDGIKAIAAAHLRFGTTSLLPTLITDTTDVMQQAADAVAQAIAEKHPSIFGIHFEGPFLSSSKKGVHAEKHVRTPSDTDLAQITRKDIGKVMVTLSPSAVDVALINELRQEGVVVALGHSDATFNQALQALKAGASGFTHLFNAMSGLGSREPGMVGAALHHREAYASLIVDHQHVHPAVVQFAINQKGFERSVLVTDAMAHAGTDLETLPFFDTEINQRDGKLTTPDGTLAGSNLTMYRAFINAYKNMQCTLAQASSMASANPANWLGLGEEKGLIAEGQRANFLLLDEKLNLKQVYLDGVGQF